MPNRAVIEAQDQFGRSVKVTTSSGAPASIKQALDAALRSNPLAKRSGAFALAMKKLETSSISVEDQRSLYLNTVVQYPALVAEFPGTRQSEVALDA